MSPDRRRVNRHGIPIYGPEPERCAWRGCNWGTDFTLKVPLCRTHAEAVYDRYRAALHRENADILAKLQANATAAASEAEPREEVIYFIQVGSHIKIGWTGDLRRRMREYPPNTTLLAVHPGTRQDERKLHKRFAVHCSHGQEWYPLVPVILEHIKRVKAEHGEPPDLTFGARPVEVPRPHQTKNRLEAKYGPTLHG